MDLMSNAIFNIFSILLLIILCVHSLSKEEDKSLQLWLYIIMLITTMLLLLLDIFSRFDGNPNTYYALINSASNYIVFLLNPVMSLIWFIYVYFEVYHDERRTKRLFVPLSILFLANTAMVIVSQFFGWFYYIDAENIYHRGPLFAFSALFTIILLFVTFLVIVINQKNINKKHLFSLIFFPIPPLIGIILQVYIYGFSFTLNCTVLSLLIVHLNIQDDSIYTDYLTGLGNRKKLEVVLKEKVSRISKKRTFSLVMLDINNFKEINDMHGHEMGDIALQATAKILKENVRSKDYITRFGGDEFCLILDISDMDSLDATVSRIHKCVDLFNESKRLPFGFSFSIGCAVYDYLSDLKPDEFLKQVDLLMYENKNINKRERKYTEVKFENSYLSERITNKEIS